MNIKRVVYNGCFFFFFLWSTSFNAQDKDIIETIQSISKTYTVKLEHTTKNSIIEKLQQELNTLHRAKKDIAVLKQVQKKSIPLYSYIQCWYTLRNGNSNALLDYANKLIAQTEEEDDFLFCEGLSFKAIAYHKKGQIPEAIETALLAKDVAEKEMLRKQESNVYNILGIVYSSINDYEKGIQYFEKAAAIAADHYPTMLKKLYANIAQLYARKKQWKLSIIYYKKTIALCKKEQVKGNKMALIYSNLSIVYYDIDSLQKAKYYIQKALKEEPNAKITSFIDVSIANLERNTKNYDKAIDYYKKALYFTQQNKINIRSRLLYKLLSNTYKEKGDYAKALFYSQEYNKLNDSMLNAVTQKKIATLENKHRIEKMENEKQVLTLKNEEQRYRIYALISLVLVCIVIVVFFVHNYFKKKKQHKILYEQIEKLIASEKILKRKIKETQIKVVGDEIRSEEEKTFTLPKDLRQKVIKRIELQILKEFFVQEKATLNELSKKVKVNPKYVSQIINEYYKMTYSKFLNELRVKHILLKLDEDRKLREYSIKAISKEVGYKSSKTFVNAFKDYTGISPAAYIENLKTKN